MHQQLGAQQRFRISTSASDKVDLQIIQMLDNRHSNGDCHKSNVTHHSVFTIHEVTTGVVLSAWQHVGELLLGARYVVNLDGGDTKVASGHHNCVLQLNSAARATKEDMKTQNDLVSCSNVKSLFMACYIYCCLRSWPIYPNVVRTYVRTLVTPSLSAC